MMILSTKIAITAAGMASAFILHYLYRKIRQRSLLVENENAPILDDQNQTSASHQDLEYSLGDDSVIIPSRGSPTPFDRGNRSGPRRTDGRGVMPSRSNPIPFDRKDRSPPRRTDRRRASINSIDNDDREWSIDDIDEPTIMFGRMDPDE